MAVNGYEAEKIMADGPGGRFLLDGFRKPGAPLAVTVESQKGRGYRITHVASGCTLWPNTWRKVTAIAVCEELLALDGWNRPFSTVVNDQRLRAAAEGIVLKRLGSGV